MQGVEFNDIFVFEAHTYLLVVVRGRPLHDLCHAILIGGMVPVLLMRHVSVEFSSYSRVFLSSFEILACSFF